MAIGNIPARKRGFGYDPVTRSLGVYTDGQLTASFPPTPGRTYFVNNITGASTNDGLSWSTPFDQVDNAISASETYRELGGVESGASVTTNDYVRNTIIIQGTGTAYEAVATAACNYINFVGLGADPRGNGTGVAQISGGTSADAFSLTATCRGDNFYNMRFDASTSQVAFDCTSLLRSTFENCSFMGDAITNSALTSAFRSTAALAGCTIRFCFFGTDWAQPTSGITLGTQFDLSEITDCVIIAATNGIIYGHTGAVLDKQALIKDNVIKAATYGIRIPYGGAGYDEVAIIDNRIIAGTAISRAGGTAYFSGDDCCLGNLQSQSGSTTWLHAIS